MREYKSLKILRSGGILEIEGLKLKMVNEEIKEGDIYIAERNTGPKFLTAKKIANGCIQPTTNEYFYDIHECVKVEEA